MYFIASGSWNSTARTWNLVTRHSEVSKGIQKQLFPFTDGANSTSSSGGVRGGALSIKAILQLIYVILSHAKSVL